MSLAMDLAALCDMWRWKWHHLAGFSQDVAFARHFMATRPPPPSHPIGVLLVLATPVKNYLKWQEIQLAIHSMVGG